VFFAVDLYQASLKMTLVFRFRMSHAMGADEKFAMPSMSQCVSVLANWYYASPAPRTRKLSHRPFLIDFDPQLCHGEQIKTESSSAGPAARPGRIGSPGSGDSLALDKESRRSGSNR
jgi:hypothetical protein